MKPLFDGRRIRGNIGITPNTTPSKTPDEVSSRNAGESTSRCPHGTSCDRRYLRSWLYHRPPEELSKLAYKFRNDPQTRVTPLLPQLTPILPPPPHTQHSASGARRPGRVKVPRLNGHDSRLISTVTYKGHMQKKTGTPKSSGMSVLLIIEGM